MSVLLFYAILGHFMIVQTNELYGKIYSSDVVI